MPSSSSSITSRHCATPQLSKRPHGTVIQEYSLFSVCHEIRNIYGKNIQCVNVATTVTWLRARRYGSGKRCISCPPDQFWNPHSPLPNGVAGSFPGCNAAEAWYWPHTYICTVPTLRIGGAIPPVPLYASSAWTGTTSCLSFYVRNASFPTSIWTVSIKMRA